MKKSLLLTLCLVAFCSVANAKTYVDDEVVLCGDMTFCDTDGNYLTGKIIKHETGNVVSLKADVKDGKLHGLSEGYYPDGKLKEAVEFQNGIPDGSSKTYYKNGKLKTETTYKNGKMNGLVKKYYESGELESEIHIKNDVPDGLAKLFYKNGKLKNESNFKDGKLDGTLKQYYENGNLQVEGTYKNGVPEGPAKEYYENGKLEAEYTYVNGKKDGVIKQYAKDSEAVRTIETKEISKDEFFGKKTKEEKKPAKTEKKTRESTIADEIMADKTNIVLGNQKGTFVIIDFFDYNCPHCKIMDKRLSDAIKKSDNIRWILMDTPIWPESEIVSKYAIAANKQGKFAEFHEEVVKIRNAKEADLKAIGKKVGLDVEKLEKDVHSEETAAKMKKNSSYIKTLGTRGVPMFLINGKLHKGAFDDSELKEMIEEANGQKDPKKNTQKGDAVAEILADKTNHVLGNPNGTFVVIEFFDYNCAYSKKMNKQMADAIKKSDNIRWVLMDSPLFGKKSEIIARYAIAANKQGKFAEFHAALEDAKDKSEEGLIKIGKDLGLNVDQLKADANSAEAKDKLAKNQKYAKQFFLNGTPLLVINGKIRPGVLPESEMKEMIDQAEKMKKKEKNILWGK